MELYPFSCFFLASTAALCMAGLILPGYRDNLLQCAGMFVLMIGCASRVTEIWARESVPPDWFMVHLGIGVFAYGVLWKTIAHNRRRTLRNAMRAQLAESELDELSAWHQSANNRETKA